MNTNNLVVGGVGLVAVLGFVFGLIGLNRPVVVNNPPPQFGAVPTLDGVDNPNVRVAGSGYKYFGPAMVATSSIVCSIPITATSSLTNFSVTVRTNGLGAQNIDLSTSSTAFGSSTPAFIKAFSAPATAFDVVWGGIATSTNQLVIGFRPNNNGYQGQSDDILFPGQFLNVRVSTTSPGTFSAGYYVGLCSGELKLVN